MSLSRREFIHTGLLGAVATVQGCHSSGDEGGERLVQYKMSLKGGVIPTQDEPGGNLGKVD